MINQQLINDGVESVKCILESNPGHIACESSHFRANPA